MTSVRLGPELEARLRQAARILGVGESQVLREAVAARCDEILGTRLDARLTDYVGAMSLGGGLSRGTGRQFAQLLASRKEPKE